MNRKALLLRILSGAIVLCVFLGSAFAFVRTAHAGPSAGASASHPVPAQPATISVNPCPRFGPGSAVTQPPDLFSHDGLLEVDLNYYTTVDPTISQLDPQPSPVPPPLATGLQEFCYATPDGQEEPTLHVRPGDRLIIHVKNDAPRVAGIRGGPND